jgi:TRAP-type C4-dicarboxylate transport system permease small subunit
MASPPEPGPSTARPPANPLTRARGPVLVEEIVAVACMAVLVLLTLANVVVRYLSDQTLAPTEEISIALIVVMTLAGASAAAARDRHVRIEYFYETGSARRRRRLGMFAAAATCLFFILLGLLAARVLWDEFRYEETSMALGVPRWWYTVWVPVLCAGIALRSAAVFGRMRAGRMLPGADGAAPDAPPAVPGKAPR